MAILYEKINLQRFSEADGHLTFDTSIDTGGVEGGIKKLGSLFNDAAKALGGGSFEKSISSFEKVGRSVSDMSSTVQKSTKGMSAAGKDIAGITKPLESSGSSVMKFSDYVKSGMNTVKDTLSTAKTTLSDFGKAAQTALGDLASGKTIGSAIDRFKGFGSSVLESVSSLGGSEGKIASFVKTTRGNLDTLGGNLITGVIDKFKSLGQGIANSAGNLGGSEGKISGFFSGVKSKLAEFGGGLVSGIIDKFKSLGKAALSSGDDLERSSGSFGRGASGIQQALAVMAGNLMTEAVHKLVDLGKSALSAGADLQQSIGGIETLFGTNGAQSVEEYAQMMGKSVDDVQEEYDRLSKAQELALGNADKAWKTAGLSANDYMQTVTSFAASLKAATGDELKAAELADQAVIDMADNANKMGTDMASIQHAYQGFSKQNYTMLDNLKLGYGGTKEEMSRLLADASALSGKQYDIKNLADVYEAIHVIQEELKITGTTSKEAEKTFTGSLAGMKAAAQNVLAKAALGEDVTETVKELGDSVVTFVMGNLLPMIGNLIRAVPSLLTGIGDAIKEKMPEIVSSAEGMITGFIGKIESDGPELLAAGRTMLTKIVDGFTEKTPDILNAGLDIIENLGSGLIDGMPDVMSYISELVGKIGTAIQEKGPEIIQRGADIITGFISGLSQNAGSLTESAQSIIGTIIDTIGVIMPELISAGIQIISALAAGIGENLPQIAAAAGEIIGLLVSWLMEHGPALLQTGMQLLISIVTGIISMLPMLVETALTLFMSFLDTILQHLPELITAGIELLSSLVSGILDALPRIAEAVVEIIKSFVKKLADKAPDIVKAGVDMLKRFIDGLHDKLPDLAKKAGEVVTTVLSTIIKSLPDIIAAGGKILGSIIAGLISMIPELPKILATIVETIWNFLTNVDWIQLGWNIVTAIGSGIIAGLKGIWEGLTSVFKDKEDKSKIDTPERDSGYPYSGGTRGSGAGSRTVAVSDDTIKGIAAASQYSSAAPAVSDYTTDFDYDKMASAVAASMQGVSVNMDSRPVGELVAPTVDGWMSKRTTSYTRGAR